MALSNPFAIKIPIGKKPQPAPEPVESVDKEDVETNVVNITPEPVKEAVKPEEETPVEQETKPARKSKTKAEAEDTDNEEEFKPVDIKYAADKTTLADISKLFGPCEVDTPWNEYIEDIQTRVNKVEIRSDINLGSCRILQAQIVNILNDVEIAKHDFKAFEDGLLGSNGLITQAKIMNSVGKNAEERARNAAISVSKYKVGNKYINLNDIVLALNIRKERLNAMYDILKEKQQALFNYITILKLEDKLNE